MLWNLLRLSNLGWWILQGTISRWGWRRHPIQRPWKRCDHSECKVGRVFNAHRLRLTTYHFRAPIKWQHPISGILLSLKYCSNPHKKVEVSRDQQTNYRVSQICKKSKHLLLKKILILRWQMMSVLEYRESNRSNRSLLRFMRKYTINPTKEWRGSNGKAKS